MSRVVRWGKRSIGMIRRDILVMRSKAHVLIAILRKGGS